MTFGFDYTFVTLNDSMPIYELSVYTHIYIPEPNKRLSSQWQSWPLIYSFTCFFLNFFLFNRKNKQGNRVIKYVENFYMDSRFSWNWNKSTKILQIFLTKEEGNINLHIYIYMLHNIYTRVCLLKNIYTEYRWEYFTLNHFNNTNPIDSSQFPPKLVK